MRICFSFLGAGVALAAGGMLVSALSAGILTASAPAYAAAPEVARTAFDFTLTAIDGKPMPLSDYRGKVVLLVNTASFCGFTPQYEGLQKLQDQYGEQGLVVIGVPSGDFKEQEYADNGEIREFCEVNFGITFPMAEKSAVRGDHAIPVYRWIRGRIARHNEPRWNFHKFLIGRNGQVIAGYASAVTPADADLNAAIRKALAA